MNKSSNHNEGDVNKKKLGSSYNGIEEQIAKAEENLSDTGDEFEEPGSSEFSEKFVSGSSGGFSSSISPSEPRKGESLEQMQPSFEFESEKKKQEEKKEQFQDYNTAYESAIRHSQDIIAPIDDMRRMNMFLDRKSADRVADARPVVNLPIMQEMRGMERENPDVVKYAEMRKDSWTHDITEVDRAGGDVRKYFRPKS
jgi:hypothetical protein